MKRMLYGPPAFRGSAPDAVLAADAAALPNRFTPVEVATAPAPMIFSASLRPWSIVDSFVCSIGFTASGPYFFEAGAAPAGETDRFALFIIVFIAPPVWLPALNAAAPKSRHGSGGWPGESNHRLRWPSGVRR